MSKVFIWSEIDNDKGIVTPIIKYDRAKKLLDKEIDDVLFIAELQEIKFSEIKFLADYRFDFIVLKKSKGKEIQDLIDSSPEYLKDKILPLTILCNYAYCESLEILKSTHPDLIKDFNTQIQNESALLQAIKEYFKNAVDNNNPDGELFKVSFHFSHLTKPLNIDNSLAIYNVMDILRKYYSQENIPDNIDFKFVPREIQRTLSKQLFQYISELSQPQFKSKNSIYVFIGKVFEIAEIIDIPSHPNKLIQNWVERD